jgi:hypothetical protein
MTQTLKNNTSVQYGPNRILMQISFHNRSHNSPSVSRVEQLHAVVLDHVALVLSVEDHEL